MPIAFLDVEPYTAVGIALASDVLASAASTATYHKNKNIDIWDTVKDLAVYLNLGRDF